MTDTITHTVELTTELRGVVDAAIREGDYANADEVVREALREWSERRDLFGYTREELRSLWEEGEQSGPAKPFTADTISELKAEARRRFEARHDG